MSRKSFVPVRAPEAQVARKARDQPRKPCPECQEKLRVSQPGDALEHEADRTADAVIGRGAPPALTPAPGRIQRQPKDAAAAAKQAAEDKKMADAAAKAAEAAAATGPGKKLIDKAGEEAKKIVSTPAGAAATAVIVGGAVAGMAAKNEKLPFQPPAIPLGDSGLKAGLRYEGPLQHPDYVGVTLGGTLPGEPHPRQKKPASGEDYRAETARLRAEMEQWKPKEPAWRPPSGAIRPLVPLVKPAAPPVAPPAPVEQKKDLPAPVQRKARTAGPVSGEPVHDALSEGGETLDPATRAFMEQRFGRDFSAVRVHAGWRGARAADALEARAFTLGAQIAFGAGEYRPASESGRRLLAHELAHVVQQGAAPRLAAPAAAAPAAAAAPIPVSPVATPAAGGTIARADKPAGKKDAVPVDIAASGDLPALKFLVWPSGSAADSGGDKLVNVEVDSLALPATKGPNALDIYSKLAAGKALAATLQVEDDPQAALWQKRAGTSSLQSRWRDARAWPSGSAADKYWEKAGGDAEFPKVGKETCQMDHIVELQLGGNNTNENIQALDGKQNQSSGGALWAELSGLARAIQGEAKLGAGKAAQIRMQFRKVKLHGTPEKLLATCKPKKPTCLSVEKCADKVKIDAADKPSAGTEPYPIATEGGHETELKLPLGFGRNKTAAPVAFEDSGNRAAQELIPGFLLLTLRHAGKSKDQMEAAIDTRGKTRLPLTFEAEKSAQKKADKKAAPGSAATLLFDVTGPKNTLKLAPGFKKIPFQYAYLSPGEITKLTPTAEGVDFVGTITPSVPFLGKLDIAYERGTLAVTKGLDPAKLKPPIRGAKITEASVGLELAPELKARGKLGFEYAPGGKKVLDASVTVSADTEGLNARGEINAYLPGVDGVNGHLEYSTAKGWSGGAKASASNLKQKFKYARDGEVEIGLKQDAKGATQIDARGKVTLDLPHTQGVTTELETKGGRWLFRGKGRFDVPKLKPIDITVEYDGSHLTGKAENIGFQYKGFDATLNLQYRDEKFSGSGKMEFEKGRAKGSLKLELLPTGKFTGEGSVTLRIKEGLEATGGIAIDKDEKVSVKGKLAFVKPISLFEGFGNEITLLETGISFPIPGASIGPVGVKARIEGALKAGYHIGPAEIRNAAVETAFNPLEDKPDFKLEISGQVWIGASAHISGSISGGIMLDLALAEASGGLTVTATAKLNGEAVSKVRFFYETSRYEVSADFAASIALAIRLALDAYVKASAGIRPFKVDTEKRWELAAKEFSTGLKLGIKVNKPLKYSSDKDLETPGASDIEITKPQLDAKKLLRDVFGSADGKEQQK